jgi:hypothetical protein
MKLVINAYGMVITYNMRTGEFEGNTPQAQYYNYLLQTIQPWQGDKFAAVVQAATQSGFTIVEYVPYPAPKFPVY